MFNIIKSEIKRLLKSKGFWTSLVIFILIYVISIFMQTTAQETDMFYSTNSVPEPGFYISVDVVVKSLNSFATMFGHSFGTLVLGIYLAIFVCSEYSSGYIKNIATLSNGRLAVIISKIVVSAFIDLIIILLCYGIGFILGSILIDGFVVESIQIILKSSAVMFIISLALFSLIIAITAIFRNRIAGIILVLLISSGMLQPFFTSLFDLINLSFLSEYTLSSLFLNSALVEENNLIKVILTSFFYIIVYNVISICIMQKRDIQ
ncbi:ABC transporter permease [Erysipelotrichaceae bacterium HCN-30851]